MSADRSASILARLLNRAKAKHEDYNLILNRFVLERLLYRLSISKYANSFLLKGAMLFALWYDVPHRPTRDMDLLGFGPDDADSMPAPGTRRSHCNGARRRRNGDEGSGYGSATFTACARSNSTSTFGSIPTRNPRCPPLISTRGRSSIEASTTTRITLRVPNGDVPPTR
jgi:Nucleotidyl transferase AbiEii toxin, Type IV TA system